MELQALTTSTEVDTSRIKYWRDKLKPYKQYPGIRECIGEKIADCNGRHWWEAIGNARQTYLTHQESIAFQLSKDKDKDKCFGTVTFHLFIIGKSKESAVPTIMFFCRDVETRKHAKATIEKSDILEKLPGFKIGHQAKRPDMGSVVLRATHIAWVHPSTTISSASEVYFDLAQIESVGMSIFVKHTNGTFRQATANLVFDGLRYLYLSVSHVFLPEHTDRPNDQAGSDDDEYDFGSDTSSGFEGETCTEVRPLSFQVRYPELPGELAAAGHSLPILSATTTKNSTLNCQEIEPNQRHLKALGTLIRASVDLDWALITIDSPEVLDTLDGTYMNERDHAHTSSSLCGGSTQVVAYTSSGPISGEVSDTPEYIRLPGSETYHKTHLVKLNRPLTWGDSGVRVWHALSHETYGHVVATSASGFYAYVMAETLVNLTAGLQEISHQPLDIVRYQRHSPRPELPEDNPTQIYRTEVDKHASATTVLGQKSGRGVAHGAPKPTRRRLANG